MSPLTKPQIRGTSIYLCRKCSSRAHCLIRVASLPEFAGSLSPGRRIHGWVVVTPGAASPSSPQEPCRRRRVGLGFLGRNPSRNWQLWAATARGGTARDGGSKP